MSVEKFNDAQGRVAYKVRWKDSAGRSRRKTVRRQQDAILLDADLKRKKALGELTVYDRGTETLDDFWPLWQANYGRAHVSPRTMQSYHRHWDKHVSPALGRIRLRDLSPEHLDRFVMQLNERLAPGSTRRIMGLLQGVLQRAVEWRYLKANPAQGVRRPTLVQRRGRALGPAQVEAIAAELDLRGATVTRVLAWTGLRPGELRALRWSDLGSGTIRVEHAVSGDEIGPTKTRKARTVMLRAEALKALREWYLASGRPAPSALIFPGHDGALWRDEPYNRWQQNHWAPAAARAGVKDVVLYDLRHTHASRLIDEGCSVVEVAGQLGHSPEQTLRTYAHEFKSVPSGCPAKPSLAEILSVSG